MAGDSVIFNTRERAVSSDWNDAQALQTRELADAVRWLQQLSWQQPTGSANLAIDRQAVLGGLIPSASGSDVVISPGALAQFSSSIVPVPGALDSGERVAYARAAEAVAAPAPGSDTVYLLEAQMVDVVTLTTTRDILDTAAIPPVFVPTLVNKRTERRITYRFRAGTATAAPAADSAWVPIAVVWRLAGGGAVAAADVWDCRPLAGARDGFAVLGSIPTERGGGRVTRRRLETVGTIASSSARLRFDFAAIDNEGERLFARVTDPTGVSIADLPQSTLASGSIAYFYLATDNTGRAISNRIAGVAHRGMLLVSNVAPTKQGLNDATITLVHGATPWGLDSVAPGHAICVGAVRFVAGVVNPCTIGESDAVIVSRALVAYGAAPDAAGRTNFDLAGFVPADARIARVRVYIIGAGTGAGADRFVTITDQATAGTPDPQSAQVYWHGSLDYSENTAFFDCDLPVGIQTTFRLNTSHATTQPPSVQIDVVGWRY